MQASLLHNLVLLVLLLITTAGSLVLASLLLVHDELGVALLSVPLEACEVGILA